VTHRRAGLASYARQANDDSLLTLAKRIQGRAVRRAGELLKQIPDTNRGRPPLGIPDAAVRNLTRTEAAAEAGLSERQKVTALRVASVDADEFEAAIESANPPTITEIAEAGRTKRPITPLNGRSASQFNRALHFVALVRRYADALSAESLDVVEFLDDGERAEGASVCEKLGIEPRVEVLPEGTDLDAYVVSVNLTRRNLTVGQRAMAYAKIYPEPTKYKRAGNSLETQELKAYALSQARTVLREMPMAAESILRGEAKLDAAYQKGGQGGVLLLANLPEAIDTRAEIAALSGVSERNISKVERIKETASPELLDAVRAGAVRGVVELEAAAPV
jgi:hypothetical protein